MNWFAFGNGQFINRIVYFLCIVTRPLRSRALPVSCMSVPFVEDRITKGWDKDKGRNRTAPICASYMMRQPKVCEPPSSFGTFIFIFDITDTLLGADKQLRFAVG